MMNEKGTSKWPCSKMLLYLQLNSYSLVDKICLYYNLKQSLRRLLADNRYISCLGCKKVVPVCVRQVVHFYFTGNHING